MLYNPLMHLQLLYTVILSIIEGITEFLPISSTAHLILTAHLLHIPQTEYMHFFEIFIQGGAIMAVFVIYLKKLWTNKKLWVLLVASFIPTGILGIIADKLLGNSLFKSTLVILNALFWVGLLFIIIETLINRNKIKLTKTIDDLDVKTAILIGVIQVLAVIPGVSRSGAIILGMLLLNYKRQDAVEYSFLLGLPTIGAAALYDAYKIKAWAMPHELLTPVILGTILSFIFALIAVKWLIKYIKSHDLKIFGYYRMILAVMFGIIG